jgi:hypothetical protein
MAKYKAIYVECSCNRLKAYSDGTFPLYFEKEDEAIDKLLWFFANYNHYKKYGKWLYEERLYWGIHTELGHIVTLRLK